MYFILVDRQTGVQYYYTQYGCTALLDENGKPLIAKDLVEDFKAD